ncbi:hypothetical protein BDV38DRAFT_187346 [Aspergillus pseudotamarii]|uniref:Uncharacterized protein n=1 Tax=Aspergillus pseudotamarii TaxID=132259 RepID=A0A5N6SIZ4_ASPPS|nr:uncharacterized protein BDV38DRAFT_187346 [Aspergillus pseudotamarii]KAE8133353.1 hypothetical protein BDV38DRAFT_187346 [Aspergillus pseudotamarii]
MFLENYPTVELPKVYISASRVRACVRSPCNTSPGRFLRSGGISDIMHGIYYLLFIIYYLSLIIYFAQFLFLFSLLLPPFKHTFQSPLPLGTNISNSIQAAHGQCPGR